MYTDADEDEAVKSMLARSEELPTLQDLGKAIELIKDAQLRIARHKDFERGRTYASPLQVVNLRLSYALEALTGMR